MRLEERERLLAFARGEATWAEVEGVTAAEAARMASTGVELARAGRLREAALVFEAMVEINPRDAGAHAALGTVYQKLSVTQQMDRNDDKKTSKDDRKKVTQLDKVDRDLNFKMERLMKRKEQLSNLLSTMEMKFASMAQTAIANMGR